MAILSISRAALSVRRYLAAILYQRVVHKRVPIDEGTRLQFGLRTVELSHESLMGEFAEQPIKDLGRHCHQGTAPVSSNGDRPDAPSTTEKTWRCLSFREQGCKRARPTSSNVAILCHIVVSPHTCWRRKQPVGTQQLLLLRRPRMPAYRTRTSDSGRTYRQRSTKNPGSQRATSSAL